MGTLNEVSSCQGVVELESIDGLQRNLFMLTNITNTIIAITADSENGNEKAGRGELCVESRKRERTF